jgi:hypothetical protein
MSCRARANSSGAPKLNKNEFLRTYRSAPGGVSDMTLTGCSLEKVSNNVLLA